MVIYTRKGRIKVKLYNVKKILILVVFILLAVILFDSLYFETNFPKINFLTIKTGKFKNGSNIRILQISDFHDKKFPRGNKKLLNIIEKQKPDIIVITGDLIDKKTADYSNVYDFVGQIVKINPNTYFVSGNHEWWNGNISEFAAGLNTTKINILNNSSTVAAVRNSSINICGIDDYNTGHANLDKAFKGIDEKLFTILLSHSPDIVPLEPNLPADLALSGHAHGGQVRIPLVGALIAPNQGLFPKYNKGLYTFENGPLLYVDSGLGTSVAPIRFLNRSQISVITIEGL